MAGIDNESKKRIIVVDDKEDILVAADKFLSRDGFSVVKKNSPVALLNQITSREIDLSDYGAMLLDLTMPGISGQEVLQQIKDAGQIEAIPIIILTADANTATAITCIKLGAWDYVLKPPHWADIFLRIQRAILTYTRYKQSEQEATDLSTALELQLDAKGGFIGNTLVIRKIFETVDKITKNDRALRILLTGESGTGKEVLARTIRKKSLRCTKAFVSVNCPAIPKDLVESELFGHEKGSFTGATSQRRGKFEIANRGIIFLDEIAEMPLHVQAKLLRVLENGIIERVGGNEQIHVDVSVIAATNKDLTVLVNAGGFRNDLYFRLNVLQIHIPPLRERKEDISLLVKFFIELFSPQHKDRPLTDLLSTDCFQAIMSYHWPGNVRELRNVIERGVILSNFPIKLEDLPPEVQNPRQYKTVTVTEDEPTGVSQMDTRINDPAMIPGCKWITAKQQRILINAMLRFRRWETDSYDIAVLNKDRRKALNDQLRSLKSAIWQWLEVEEVQDPSSTCDVTLGEKRYVIGNSKNHHELGALIRDEFAQKDPGTDMNYATATDKIQKVIVAADLLLGSWKERVKIFEAFVSQHQRGGISLPRHIHFRIDLLTLKLLRILPDESDSN